SEKPASYSSNLVFAGLVVLEPGFSRYLEKVGKSVRGELEFTQALNDAASQEHVTVAEIGEDEWADLTYPWDVLKIHRRLMQEMKTDVKGKIEAGATVSGPVSIGSGSLVKAGSYIEGPVWIGCNTTVGPNSYIRPYTAIEDDCRIGNACEIKGSVIYSRTHVAHLSYVGDSVICEDVNMGAGTVVANLRFDEKPVKVRVNGVSTDSGMVKLGCFMGPGAKTGVNVSINPGVRICKDARIPPGTVVSRDVLNP
ncbi:MAG: nucleotidyl transferase, partial [Thermoprotei archaeon]